MNIIPSAFLNELAYFRPTVHLDNINKFHSYETSSDESQNNFNSWTLDLYNFVSIIIILRIFFWVERLIWYQPIITCLYVTSWKLIACTWLAIEIWATKFMNIFFTFCCPVLPHCYILHYYCLMIFIFKDLEIDIPIKKTYHLCVMLTKHNILQTYRES